MHKYSLSDYFDNWTRNTIISFPILLGREFLNLAAHENNAQTEYAFVHQDIEILNKTFS